MAYNEQVLQTQSVLYLAGFQEVGKVDGLVGDLYNAATIAYGEPGKSPADLVSDLKTRLSSDPAFAQTVLEAAETALASNDEFGIRAAQGLMRTLNITVDGQAINVNGQVSDLDRQGLETLKDRLNISENTAQVGITPWSESRSDNPVDLPDDLEIKNSRQLNPLAAPDFYYEFYDGKAETVSVKDPKTGDAAQYELVQNYGNEETSSHFKVVRNGETGHYIVMSKGMDMPFRDESAGSWGFREDIRQHSAAEDGELTGQVLDGEQVYLDLLQNPDVKSIEVIGYSMGTIPANYLASVYDAQVTNIADLGVPGTLNSAEAKHTKESFNVSSKGLFPAATGEFKNNLNENVVGLKLFNDVMGDMDVGQEFGERILLDAEEVKIFPVSYNGFLSAIGVGDLSGLAHVPQVYAENVAEHFEDAPRVETTKETEFVWSPVDNSL